MREIKDKKSVIFSVVVPTRGRVNLLKNLLASLQRARLNCNGPVEVIIVDDSPPDQQNQIKQLCQRFEVRYFNGPSNVRKKRNIGIKEARGEIILFVDSDCEVSQDIFKEHLQMYNNPDTGGVLGLTEFVGKETTTWKIVRRTKFLDAFSFAKTLCNYIDSAPWGTCTNLSLRRKILERVGGFDTNFPFRLGGDDTELGIRINKAGHKIKMNPDAVVFHTRETWNNFLAVAKRIFRWGRMDYYVFYKKHSDKLLFTLPKPITIFFSLLFFGFIKTAISISPIALFLPFVWLLIFLFLNSAFKIISADESLKNIFFEIPAQFLHFLFDFGTAFESIKNTSLLMFYKQPLDDPREVIFLWNEKVREMWSIILSAFISLAIFMVMI